jgi:hypothetical protein
MVSGLPQAFPNRRLLTFQPKGALPGFILSMKKNKDEEKGYDSDEGPFLDAVVAEGVQDFDYDDEAVGDGKEDDEGASNEVPSVVGTFQDISLPNLNSFKMERLRFELKIRGIDTKGLKKGALQDRLKKALAERVVIRIEPQAIEQEQENICGDFQSPLIGKY